jgi:hypothetical protein
MLEQYVLTLVRPFEQHFPFTLHLIKKITMAHESFRMRYNFDI